MTRPLRGAIIGCGYFGRIQVEAWRRIQDAVIVAACDRQLERARAAAPAAYASPEEMIERETLDFVDIATRPDSHLPLVKLAAARGLAIICQKPMAPSWEDAVAMAETAEAAGIRLMIHENWRWQPWYREVGRRIEAGEIGRPLAYLMITRKRDGLGPAPYPNQPYFAEMPRLLIHETMVHHIDTARFLFREVTSVMAMARRVNPIIAGEDQALLLLAHENELRGVIDGNRLADLDEEGPVMGQARFEGDDGVLTLAPAGDLFRNGQPVWRHERAPGYRGDCVLATQQHFIGCLRSGAPFETGARAYLKTFAAVEAAYESVRAGCAVRTDKWA